MQEVDLRERMLRHRENLDAKIAWHEKELVELRRLRDAFDVVSDWWNSGGHTPLLEPFLAAMRHEEHRTPDPEVLESDTVPLSETAEAAYGDMARSLRKFIVQGVGRLRTRKEIIAAAKEMGSSSNFPYRFLKRMQDTGELLEVARGQYIATSKMLKKVEGI